MTDFALPPSLQRGIAEQTAGFSGRDLALRAGAMSERYRGRASSRIAIATDEDAAAYLTTRMPATYAATLAAMAALQDVAPDFAPRSLLDVGCGPGTASWAASEIWPDVERIAMLDENDAMLGAGRQLQTFSESEALRKAQILKGGIPEHLPEGKYDLVAFGYALAELGETRRHDTLAALWQRTGLALVIVEPGTPEGFRRIAEARDALLALGANIAAPCPHANACPMLPPDWCHFAQRLPRSRDHMRAKGASVPFEDEKFSYLAVTRDVLLSPPSARILDRPAAEKGGLRFKLCSTEGLGQLLAPKRDRPSYRAASRKKWGDRLDF